MLLYKRPAHKTFGAALAIVLALFAPGRVQGQAQGSPTIQILLGQHHLSVPPRIVCDLKADPHTYLQCLYDNAYPQIIDPSLKDALWQLSVIQVGELMLDESNPDLKSNANPYYLMVQLSVSGPAPHQVAFKQQACGAADVLVNQLLTVWNSTPTRTIPLLTQNDFTQSFRFYSASPCCVGATCSVQHLMGWDRELDVIHQAQIKVQVEAATEKTTMSRIERLPALAAHFSVFNSPLSDMRAAQITKDSHAGIFSSKEATRDLQ